MKHKLSAKLLLLSAVNSIILAAVVMMIVYVRLNDRMVGEYTRMAQGTAELMISEFDADRINDYLELNYSMEEYNRICEKLALIKNAYPDVLYMYIYICTPEGGITVFDICEDPDEPGYVYEFDDGFLPYMEELCNGKELPALTDHTRYGYLLTYTKPVFDSRGDYACTVFLDFSMDELHAQDIKFVLTTIAFLAVVMVLLLVIYMAVINRIITDPINRMSESIGEFKYDTEEDRFKNLRLIEKLDIRTDDEIETLYSAFVSSAREALYYTTNLNIAKADIVDRDETIAQISSDAYKDSLTGVGNKTAYINEIEKVNRDIAKGKTEIGVLVMDINNLKYVNDNFGHDHGDAYIKGCSSILCNLFKKSPVFRIGGDEFAAILKNDDYHNRDEKYRLLTESYEKAFAEEEKEPYERYSASVGMSEYTEGDEGIREAFKRADVQMYSNKEKFREKYGRYR